MKNIRGRLGSLLIALILSVIAVAPAKVAEGNSLKGTAVYDPAREYKGPYAPNNLYYKYPGSNWLRGVDGSFPAAISCRSALSSLSLTGRWQGHFGYSGTCGPLEEPTDWALGNRLNFESQAEED